VDRTGANAFATEVREGGEKKSSKIANPGLLRRPTTGRDAAIRFTFDIPATPTSRARGQPGNGLPRLLAEKRRRCPRLDRPRADHHNRRPKPLRRKSNSTSTLLRRPRRTDFRPRSRRRVTISLKTLFAQSKVVSNRSSDAERVTLRTWRNPLFGRHRVQSERDAATPPALC